MSVFECPVVTIKTVTKHPNADKLDIVTFEEIGWSCVDSIGKRKVGDHVVYIPVDSIVDTTKPEFTFLKDKAKDNGKARIKTIKLRGEYSQGLCVDLPEKVWNPSDPASGMPNNEELVLPYVGMDTMYHFKIEKFEPELHGPFNSIPNNAKGNRPEWIPKTDEERYQNINRIIERYKDEEFIATIKMDGASTSVFYDSERIGDEFGVTSRNLERKEFDPKGNDDMFWKAAKDEDLHRKVKEIAQEYGFIKLACQSELCGPSANGNHAGLEKNTLFNFYFCGVKQGFQGYLDLDLVLEICDKNKYDIKRVPYVFDGLLSYKLTPALDFSFIHTLKYETNGTPVEGVVFTSRKEKHLIEKKLHRLSFKYINPEFKVYWQSKGENV